MIRGLLFRSLRRLSTSTHGHQLNTDINFSQRKESFEKYYSRNEPLKGHCTAAASLAYSQRNPEVDRSNFKKPIDIDLTLSSVGVGTYTNENQQHTDLSMYNAIVDSVMSGGVNVVDTCSSFRHSRSERVVNAALRYLVEGGYQREELFLSSKSGYLPDDSDNNTKGIDIINEMVKEGLLKNEDVQNGSHCIHPAFLEYSLERSLVSMGLQTIDVMYLNNVIENHLPFVGADKFWKQLHQSFEFYESMCKEGKIKWYGITSWASLRLPRDDKDHVDLQKVVQVAKKVGGSNHHLKFVQFPISVMMPESFAELSQNWLNPDTKKVEEHPLLTVAYREKINVISLSPLMNGVLVNVPLPSEPLKVSGIGAKHLQFIRSIPAPALLTTLIGHKRNRHVKSNLEVVSAPILTNEEWVQFIKPAVRKEVHETPS